MNLKNISINKKLNCGANKKLILKKYILKSYFNSINITLEFIPPVLSISFYKSF
jgi:hypothetical protein